MTVREQMTGISLTQWAPVSNPALPSDTLTLNFTLSEHSSNHTQSYTNMLPREKPTCDRRKLTHNLWIVSQLLCPPNHRRTVLNDLLISGLHTSSHTRHIGLPLLCVFLSAESTNRNTPILSKASSKA